MRMRQCPFCGASIDSNKFACARDWHRLSVTQQQTIYAAYDDFLAGAIDRTELRALQDKIIADVQRRKT